MEWRHSVLFRRRSRSQSARCRGKGQGCQVAAASGVLELRGQRVLEALVISAALTVGGAFFQGLFHNPFGLARHSQRLPGAAHGSFFSLGVFGIKALAFASGHPAVADVYAIGTAMRVRSGN